MDTFTERYPGREADLIDAYTRWNLANMERLVTPYPGIRMLLEGLAEAGIRVGIVTSKRREAAERTLAVVGLTGVIDIVCAMEDTAEHKPAPAPLLRAFGLLGAEPAATCYVGDAVVDLRAAQAARCAGIGVTWGSGLREELESVPAIGICDRVEALADLLFGRV